MKKIGDVEDNDESIEKYGKLSKTRKLFKSKNLKCEKLSKAQKSVKSEKNYQKMGIPLILILKKTSQAF